MSRRFPLTSGLCTRLWVWSAPRTGIPGVLGTSGNIGLALNETTLAELVKPMGYATGIFGKWCVACWLVVGTNTV